MTFNFPSAISDDTACMETIPTLSVLYKNRLIPSVVPNCMIILSWDNFNWRVPNAFSKTSKLPDPCSRITAQDFGSRITNGILFSSSIVISSSLANRLRVLVIQTSSSRIKGV